MVNLFSVVLTIVLLIVVSGTLSYSRVESLTMAVETMESAPATISAANATVAGSSLPFSFSPRQQTQLHDRLNSSRRSRLHEGKSHASPRRKEVPLSLVGLLVTAVLGLLLGFFKLHQCRQQALKTNSETEGTILRRLAEGGHEENDCVGLGPASGDVANVVYD
ncbi:Toxoplasma gondii family B protein [Toxoplasma gondii TgCatPRC2]|uniref:Toxoplasma gondii family B protein n=13 Tax=Toxoplasma gondii TaxID=5811 RepID=A0A125YM94_TOXGV|nr:Toxoplasma gondii family B protein [Toxoplasma gondii ME49]EPR59233.1 Toxoplasma gondii family B protein [Toxoplasma gondii GT1]ESS30208.1 Toxoplasma gondii family B protein [Toxoplasma gondii VEG]KAF4645510.1 Toxoplasma gondii family B protein [Toxoplasma gondii]KFG29896.1 Toxoplasma gondii family B protein [Toxoplasma gondii GAB2-2007-GAL-DOM2]KFG37383.1 Toxoplasma gondii family B protein [Toxoplasma gondii FOU]KFG58014.1 Toxoplasma gondii family B protein [Toxoplasma gondii RUB]KFH0147|eukprot:XP_002371629.2 Toxoplasma gondii family B protein [Toxoplasma gondii ME49]